MAVGAPDYGQYGEDYTGAGRAYSPQTTFFSSSLYYSSTGAWGEFPGDDVISYTYIRNNGTDYYVTYKFYGSFLGVVFADWNDNGIMGVSVDGGTETLVDTYANKVTGWRNLTVFTDLTDAEHEVKIRVTGTKNPSSGGYYIRFCGILVDRRRNVIADLSEKYKSKMAYMGSTYHGLYVRSESDDYPVWAILQGNATTTLSALTGAYNLICDTSGRLIVNVNSMPTVTITATDLDIRDLAYASDSVTAWQGGTWSAGRTWTLSSATDSVNAVQSGTWNIGTVTTLTGITNAVTVSATHLDIRHLNSTDDIVSAVESGTWTFVKAATTKNEYNITMTLADTEYSQALPAGTKKFEVRVRDGTAARYAFTTGKVAGSTSPYFTLGTGEVKWEDNLNLTGVTIYFACSSPGKIIELLVWS